jgi:hypothetical protein
MTDKIQDRLLKASRYEVRKEAADYIDKLEAVVEKVAEAHFDGIRQSGKQNDDIVNDSQDKEFVQDALAILCKAAVVKGQSVQDFVFLAAWDAAGLILNEEPEK